MMVKGDSIQGLTIRYSKWKINNEYFSGDVNDGADGARF